MKSLFSTRRRTTLAAAAIATLSVGGFATGSALAAGTSDATSMTFTGFLTNSVGVLYHVVQSPSRPHSCARGSHQVTWNQAGPQGRGAHPPGR